MVLVANLRVGRDRILLWSGFQFMAQGSCPVCMYKAVDVQSLLEKRIALLPLCVQEHSAMRLEARRFARLVKTLNRPHQDPTPAFRGMRPHTFLFRSEGIVSASINTGQIDKYSKNR